MILVTVGTHNHGFNRLVRAADDLARSTAEPLIIQYGSGTYVPRHTERCFRFTSGEEMERLTVAARAVVMHGGAGSLIMALLHGKPVVVVPRLRRYHEVRDEHQLQLAHALESQGRAVAIMEPSAESLASAVERAASLGPKPVSSLRLVETLRGELSTWESARRGP